MGAFIAVAFIGSYIIASGYFSRPQPAPAVARWSRYEGSIAAEANGL